MSWGEIVSGLEAVKVDRRDSTGALAGAKTAFPGAQSLNYNVVSDSTDVKGDDTVMATIRSAKKVEGSITVAKVNLAALCMVTGGVTTPGGTGTNLTVTQSETDSAPSLFFALYALSKAYDASGAGYYVVLNNLQITSGPDETLAVDDVNTPTLDFSGNGISGVLLTRQSQQTKTAIPA